MGSHRRRHASARLASGKRAGGVRYIRPSFEPLESRCLLAVLGLDIQLLRDNNGSPGPSFSDVADVIHGSNKPLAVNDFFWVQVLAWDDEPRGNAGFPAPGIISLPLNMAWNPDVIDYVGENPDPDLGPNPDRVPGLEIDLPDFSDLLTPNFTEQRFLTDYDGTADDPTQLDGFRNPPDPTNANLLGLRGAAVPALGLGAPIGTLRPDGMADPPTWFSRLRFRAIAAADETPFVIQLAGSMSFADAAALDQEDGIVHVIDGGARESADDLNRITEFIEIVQTPGSLSGFVYVDTNSMNGILDRDGTGTAVEFGIPNVTISLFRDGQLVGTSTTGADGGYLFDELDAGVYRIVETQPPNFASTSSSVGTILPGNTSSGAAGIDEISNIQLGASQDGINYNFGEIITRPDKRMLLARTDMREIVANLRGVAALTVDGTAGNDAIVVQPVGSALRITNQTTNTVRQIPLANARILYVDSKGGQDSVTFHGTSGGEVATLSPGNGTLRLGGDYNNANFAVMALAAEQVIADGGSGDDLAVFYDSPSNDALVAAGSTATLTSADGRSAQALAFERIRALSPAHPGISDTDTSDADATDFVLETAGKWQSI